MATTVPRIEPDVLNALRRGELQALQRVFRDQYAALVHEAADELGEAGSPSTVVERAFVAVWERRTDFASPEALETFLHEGVRHGAVRERARRAAVRRLEAHEGVHHRAGATPAHAESVDAAWARVAHMLEATAESHAAAHASASEVSRHKAAEHLAGVAKQPSWAARAAAGALLIGATAAGLWWAGEFAKEGAVTNALASSEARVITTKPGQRATMTLDDGSTVALAPATQLRIVPRFGADLRAVALDGAATFMVAPGLKEPLEVRAWRAAIIATGTVFTVRAYADEGALTVGVTEGEVTLEVGRESRVLAAGNTLSVSPSGEISEPSPAAREEALAWTNGRFVVGGRSLRDVLPQLKRWYALDLKVSDPALLGRPVTMNAGLDSVRAAITALEASASVQSGYDDKVMVLRDAPPKAAAERPARRR